MRRRPSADSYRTLKILFFKIFSPDNFNQKSDLSKLKYLKEIYPNSTIYVFAKDDMEETVKNLEDIDEAIRFEKWYKRYVKLPMTLRRLRKIKFDYIILPFRSKSVELFTFFLKTQRRITYVKDKKTYNYTLCTFLKEIILLVPKEIVVVLMSPFVFILAVFFFLAFVFSGGLKSTIRK